MEEKNKLDIYLVLQVLEKLIKNCNICSKCGCRSPNPYGECECSYGVNEPPRTLDVAQLQKNIIATKNKIEDKLKIKQYYIAIAKATYK